MKLKRLRWFVTISGEYTTHEDVDIQTVSAEIIKDAVTVDPTLKMDRYTIDVHVNDIEEND